MPKSHEDVSGTKIARQMFSRRGIDLTRADIRVMHGVCYLRGQVSRLKGVEIPDLRAELEVIGKILRQKPEIRDVVIDVTYRE
jgi:hypothetical protein